MKVNQLAILGTASLLVSSFSLASNASTNYVTNQSANSIPTIVAQAQKVAVSMGNFVAAEKPTTGTAKIVKEGRHYYLELDAAFSTSNLGPDLHVLLDPNANPPQMYENMNQPVNLGKLHQYSGAQRYPLPDALNPANFKSVVIWCRMANATFGYAPLQATTNPRM